MTAGVIRIVQF